jgi:hypothetical protein
VGGISIPFTLAAHLRAALLWLFWTVLLVLAVRVAMRSRRSRVPAADC